jgi:ABC-type proline/glycine betaine transport system permease subunit
VSTGAAWYNLSALAAADGRTPLRLLRQHMSKKMQSTIMLFLIGVGFGIFSLYSLVHAHSQDDVIQAVLYMVPAVAAFGALLLLPFKQTS